MSRQFRQRDAALPLPEDDLEPYDVTVVAVGVPRVSAPLNRTSAMDVFFVVADLLSYNERVRADADTTLCRRNADIASVIH